MPVHVKPAEPSVQPLASKQLLALWNAPLDESVDAAAQSVRRAGQEIPALGTAPIDAPVVAAGHAVQPGLVEESLSAAGPWAGQESPAPIQEPVRAEKHVEESLGAAGPVQAGEIPALMDEPVAAAGHAAQTGQDIPAPIEEPMEAAEPVVEPEGNYVKASEDRDANREESV